MIFLRRFCEEFLVQNLRYFVQVNLLFKNLAMGILNSPPVAVSHT